MGFEPVPPKIKLVMKYNLLMDVCYTVALVIQFSKFKIYFTQHGGGDCKHRTAVGLPCPQLPGAVLLFTNS